MTTKIQRPQRSIQTERAYRNSLYKVLIEMLRVMNPVDEISWRGMKYEGLSGLRSRLAPD